MALDPIQRSPYEYYPLAIDAGGGISKQFNEGYGSAQTQESNRIAMDTAQQAQRTNDQLMRLRDAEERRKQLLFQQSQGDRARIAQVAATPWNPNVPSVGGGVSPNQAGSGTGNVLPLPPGYTPPAVVNSYSNEGGGGPAPAPAPPPAPPPAPGPGAAYEPSSQKPDWYNPQPRVAGLVGPQFAQNTTQTNDARGGGYGGTAPSPTGYYPGTNVPRGVPTVNPYGNVDPNASGITQDYQSASRALGVGSAINEIQNQLSPPKILPGRVGELYAQGVGSARQYLFGSPQTAAARDEVAAARAWYDSQETQAFLRANPQILQAAQQNPLAIYNARYSLPEMYSGQPGAAANRASATMEGGYTDAGLRNARVIDDTRTLTSEQKRTAIEENYPVLSTQPITITAVNGSATGSKVNSDPVSTIRNSTTPTAAISISNAFEKLDIAQQRQGFDTVIAQSERAYKMAMQLRDFKGAQDAQMKGTEAILAKEQLQYMDYIVAFNNGNYGPLANVLNQVSRQNGGDMKLQPKYDGTFDIINGDKVVESGVLKEQIVNAARIKLDTQYKTQIAAMQKIQMEVQKQIAIENAKVLPRMAEKTAEQEAQLMIELAKLNQQYRNMVGLEQFKHTNKAEELAWTQIGQQKLEEYKNKLMLANPNVKLIADPNNAGVFIKYDNKGNSLGVAKVVAETIPDGKGGRIAAMETGPDGKQRPKLVVIESE